MKSAGIMMDNLIQALGWMLVHSLWQAGVLALLVALTLSLISHKRSSLHYRVLLLSLIIFFVTCTYTFFFYWNNYGHYGSESTDTLLFVTDNSTTFQPVTSFFGDSITSFITVNAPLLVLFWSFFFCYRLAKNLGGWVYAYRIRHQHVFSPPPEWNERFSMLVKQMHLKKKIKLFESGLMHFPVTLGFLKPVVLMPLGMLCALPPGQVEAVLRHELAHVRRNDYLVNLFQLATETIFFFNPGLLWISDQLREKREFCCDDIAVDYADNKEEFLFALLHFKSLSIKRMSLGVGFSGHSTQLHKRVIRILSDNASTRSVSIYSFVYIALIAILFFAAIHIIPNRQPVNNTVVKENSANDPTVLNVETDVPQEKKDTHIISLKRNVGREILAKKTREQRIPMDSVTLSMLTGEFNTIYENSHYIIGVAKSRITFLTVNGETISPVNWHQYDNVFAGIINQFKAGMGEPAKPTQQSDEHLSTEIAAIPVSSG